MSYSILSAGESRSFSADDAFRQGQEAGSDVLVIVGEHAGKVYREMPDRGAYSVILIELGDECLGVHTGERRGLESSNVLGFARFRLGNAEPSQLVELVRQSNTQDSAVMQARALFESYDFRTAVCADFPGRIVNRLVRPYYNAALAKLDAGLASADDLDLTLKLGLGYPEGPIELLERTGLAEHCDVTETLYHALGEQPYAPARRAQVARQRRDQ